MKQQYPTIKQANLIFLIVSLGLLASSTLLINRIGLGSNLWINEFIWILSPVLILAKIGRWSTIDVLKYVRGNRRNEMLGMFSAICLWFFSFYISRMIGLLLDSKVGAMNINTTAAATSNNQAILLIIGMLVLAPICEETFFRGFVQSAYEKYSKRYAFIFSAILFGMFHILNGITEVIPTFCAGLLLGYLVYRTGSIVTSMLAHMVFNACAIFFGGVMGTALIKEIPAWMHFVCLGGLLLAVFLLSRLKANDQKEAIEDEPETAKYSKGSLALFILSGIFVVFVGASEIILRLSGK